MSKPYRVKRRLTIDEYTGSPAGTFDAFIAKRKADQEAAANEEKSLRLLRSVLFKADGNTRADVH
jgi:hypothetical protein